MKLYLCLFPAICFVASCAITGFEDRYKISESAVKRIVESPPYPEGLQHRKKETVDGVLKLDLDRTISLFLKNNDSYLTQLENIFVSEINARLAYHQYHPILNPLSFSFKRDNAVGKNETQDRSISSGITQKLPLPIGGNITLQSSLSNSQSADFHTELSDHSYSLSNSISLSLPLLKGSGFFFGYTDIAQSQRAFAYAKRDFADFKETTLINVVNNYYNLLQQKKQIENFKSNLESAKKLLARAQIEFDLGRKRKSEVFRAQVEVTNAENQLKNAEEDYKLAEDVFKIDIGLDISAVIELEPIKFEFKEIQIEQDEYINKVLTKSRAWQTTVETYEDVKRSVYTAYNSLLPDLNLTVTAKEDKGSRNISDDYSKTSDTLTSLLSLNYPLDRFPVRAAFHQQLLAFVRAQRDFEIAKDQLVRQAKARIIGVKRAEFNVQSNQRAVDDAEKNLLLVEIEFQEGVGNRTSLDVVTAQRDVLRAKNDLERSIVNFKISTLQLKQFITELDVTKEKWFVE
ncbi:MAG: TolC family protein [Planctomycetes bacterium]|nr:TolC family protein [Planctomycetota bacterium]